MFAGSPIQFCGLTFPDHSEESFLCMLLSLTQVNGGNLKETLTRYIQNNSELYRKILKFQVIKMQKYLFTVGFI